MLEATTGYIIAFLPRKRDIVVDGAIVARAERAMAGFSYSMRSQVVKLELGEAGLGLSILVFTLLPYARANLYFRVI